MTPSMTRKISSHTTPPTILRLSHGDIAHVFRFTLATLAPALLRSAAGVKRLEKARRAPGSSFAQARRRGA
jgi:hypothetical protein